MSERMITHYVGDDCAGGHVLMPVTTTATDEALAALKSSIMAYAGYQLAWAANPATQPHDFSYAEKIDTCIRAYGRAVAIAELVAARGAAENYAAITQRIAERVAELRGAE